MRQFVMRTSALISMSAFIMACQPAADPTADIEKMAAMPVVEQTEQALMRLPQDEIIYFVLPDRFANGDASNDKGGFEGGRLDHGFDPEDYGFFHGGDLKGITEKLDYIQGLGATAVWLSPIFKNKPVQGEAGQESAGYHGYWITDFLSVDPHLGTNGDFKAFVEAVHARDMRVYMDIITNHTADVISYRECHDPDYKGPDKVEGECVYRSVADYPFTRRGGIGGEPINEGFIGDGPEGLTRDNFERLTRADFAYTPYVREGEEEIKNPAWLNDLTKYHNRGETTFEGENSLYGDFVGLDDLATEDPDVVSGMIEIYKHWISEYKVDGYRIDTARHVRPEFWRQFLPAIREHAKAEGKTNFHIFGEVYEPDVAQLAYQTRVNDLDSSLDFPLQDAIAKTLVDGEAAREFERLFNGDILYPEGVTDIMPTFTGNHDMGRISGFLRANNSEMSDEEMLARVRLAYGIIMTSRGVPVIYYGDEQGFVSDGNDRHAREDMFESRTAIYNDNDLIGTDATTAEINFDEAHPLYAALRKFADIRRENTALRRGKQILRHTDLEGGFMAYSRLYAGEEYLVAINMDKTARDMNVRVNGYAETWEPVLGTCQQTANAAGSFNVTVPALDIVICKSRIVE